jgi:hypothetical protein
VQKVVKIGLGQHPNVGFNQGISGGGMTLAREQGNFAEEVTGAQSFQ